MAPTLPLLRLKPSYPLFPKPASLQLIAIWSHYALNINIKTHLSVHSGGYYR
jgi:hypothetical protein